MRDPLPDIWLPAGESLHKFKAPPEGARFPALRPDRRDHADFGGVSSARGQ